ncbi:hypothetical protein ACL02R_18790 [Streptomyces sp. MS19]|uniref:hypothetical protein n=1 Tax=Streptomyces sp. MS19 TaxID=3385972 RepID=UPI0039A257C9
MKPKKVSSPRVRECGPEAVRLLREEPGPGGEAEVARLTGWAPDVVRRLTV